MDNFDNDSYEPLAKKRRLLINSDERDELGM